MYHNQRHCRARISDNSVMRDAMMETCDLYISVLRAGVSHLCVSQLVSTNLPGWLVGCVFLTVVRDSCGAVRFFLPRWRDLDLLIAMSFTCDEKSLAGLCCPPDPRDFVRTGLSFASSRWSDCKHSSMRHFVLISISPVIGASLIIGMILNDRNMFHYSQHHTASECFTVCSDSV
jgi:hypothetical protein